MPFTIIARDAKTGTALAELRNVSQRSLRLPFLRTPTLAGQVDANHPQAPLLLALDKTIISAYDLSIQAAPLFQGPVIGYQKQRDGSGGTIQFTAAGMGWRLDHRYIGENNAGATFGTNALALLDRGELIGRTIDALNTGEATSIFTIAGDTGIRRGTITASSSTYVGPVRYTVASEFINGLTGTLDGPDMVIRPVAPTADSIGVQYAAIDVAPVIGQVQPNVAWEFGTGQSNVASWTDVGDSNTLANRAVNLPSGFPDNAVDAPISWDDTQAGGTSIAERGLHETVVAADLQTADLRTRLVQEHVRVRKTPRRVISFQPVAEDPGTPISERRVPRLFADYGLGDTVVFRAVERYPVTDTSGTVVGYSEQKTVDALLRVFAADVSIDDNGVASVALTLQSDGS